MNPLIDWLLVNLEPGKVERALLKVISILQLVRQIKDLRATRPPAPAGREPKAGFRLPLRRHARPKQASLPLSPPPEARGAWWRRPLTCVRGWSHRRLG